MTLDVVEVGQEQQQAEAAPSVAALERKIAQQQKELSKVEDTAREVQERLQQITARYDEHLRRLASGEEPEADLPDFKEKRDVLSDAVREVEADCEAKRKELKALSGQLSVLQAEETKKKNPETAALERKSQTG
jgi:chromosome segregation ATPase